MNDKTNNNTNKIVDVKLSFSSKVSISFLDFSAIELKFEYLNLFIF